MFQDQIVVNGKNGIKMAPFMEAVMLPEDSMVLINSTAVLMKRELVEEVKEVDSICRLME